MCIKIAQTLLQNCLFLFLFFCVIKILDGMFFFIDAQAEGNQIESDFYKINSR